MTKGHAHLVLVTVVATAALAGCGSSGSSGSDKAVASANGLDTTAAQRIDAELRRSEARPTGLGITKPLGAPIPKGKTIYWLQCSSPACTALTAYLKPAVAAVGWKLRVVNAGLTPESVKAAWDLAARDKPDAVIASGFSRKIYEPELQMLAKAGVPVLNMTTADPPENGFAATFKYGPDYYVDGRQIAEYALSKSGKDVNAVSIVASAFANLGFVADGFERTIKKECPSCPVDRLDVPATSIGQDLPTRVSAYLQSHPKVNWVYIGYADMMIGVPAALSSAGVPKDVRFVTIDTNPPTATYIKHGDYLVASAAFGKAEIMWRCVDFLLRHFAGKSTAQDTSHDMPRWLLTADNVPSTTTDFPLVPDYQQQYKKLWGLG